MNKQTIEKFLKSNQLDEKFYHQISLGALMINANGIDFSIDIDDIKSIGLNYRCIIFETQFGRFEFLRKDNLTYCHKIKKYIKQDILCIKCNLCKLKIKEIEDFNKKIMKYIGAD